MSGDDEDEWESLGVVPSRAPVLIADGIDGDKEFAHGHDEEIHALLGHFDRVTVTVKHARETKPIE